MEDWFQRNLDKFAHFGLGSAITAAVAVAFIVSESAYGFRLWLVWGGLMMGTAVALLFALIKDLIADSAPDWKDILATMLGPALLFAAAGIGQLFHLMQI